MKLVDVKKRALVLADEIDNELEYTEQLIEAINQVQQKLVLFARNKIKYEVINAVNNVITLPSDCYELMEVKNTNLSDVPYAKLNNASVKVALDGEYTLKYKAFLPNITTDTEDDFEIEVEPIAEACLATGVASWISVDNPELYDVLTSEYNNLLANLASIPETVNENSNNGITRIGGWYW